MPNTPLRQNLSHHLSQNKTLNDHAKRLGGASLETLITAPERSAKLVRSAAGLRLDGTRQLLDAPALLSLLDLAETVDLPGRARALLDGEMVNNTEQRPALHSLLRASQSENPAFGDVSHTRERMRILAEGIRAGALTGYSGRPFSDIVNIGIGGSDLGPRLVGEALAEPGALPCIHFVANVDPEDIRATLTALDPSTTLIVICSKSFRTEETLANALAARAWLLDSGASETDLARHVYAVTTNLEAAGQFGLPADNCLPLWDWVGGRYSVWSAVGLSCAIAIGWDAFLDFLAGGAAMDEHFRSAAPCDNLPMLMALLEIWNCQYLGAGNHVVLPYSHRLRRLPDFLQQLTMESNGKCVDLDGHPLPVHSAPVLWGSAGTIGQHSFHQLLHQGTRLCPVDFVLPLAPTAETDGDGHTRLVANCLAQSRALLVGRSIDAARSALLARGRSENDAERLAPHLSMPGNRPHSLITFDRLTPHHLGALLALYEHRTYASSVIWGINAFDQWGVELGKEIGEHILQVLKDTGDGDGLALDPATDALIAAWREANTTAHQ